MEHQAVVYYAAMLFWLGSASSLAHLNARCRPPYESRLFCDPACSTLYRCELGAPVVQAACSEEGRFCSPLDGRCVSEDVCLRGVGDAPPEPITCNYGAPFPHPTDCTWYHMCRDVGVLSDVTECRVGQGFSVSLGRCNAQFLGERVCTEGPMEECLVENQSKALIENNNYYYVCKLKDGGLYHDMNYCEFGPYDEVNKVCPEVTTDSPSTTEVTTDSPSTTEVTTDTPSTTEVTTDTPSTTEVTTDSPSTTEVTTDTPSTTEVATDISSTTEVTTDTPSTTESTPDPSSTTEPTPDESSTTNTPPGTPPPSGVILILVGSIGIIVIVSGTTIVLVYLRKQTLIISLKGSRLI